MSPEPKPRNPELLNLSLQSLRLLMSAFCLEARRRAVSGVFVQGRIEVRRD